MAREKGTYRCTVHAVFPNGPHGPYALATSDDEDLPGTVTFSLSPDNSVWRETRWPEGGHDVIVSDVTLKASSSKKSEESIWRAYSARFLRPEDGTD